MGAVRRRRDLPARPGTGLGRAPDARLPALPAAEEHVEHAAQDGLPGPRRGDPARRPDRRLDHPVALLLSLLSGLHLGLALTLRRALGRSELLRAAVGPARLLGPGHRRGPG